MVRELKTHKTIILFMVVIALNSLSYANQPTLKDILSKPGIAEELQANYAGRTTYDGQQDTPLVVQARKFALRINPPPPPEPVQPRPADNAPIRPQVEISAKFKLIGTSYHFGDQAQSWALIDEVGKGLHWVKQGGKVGYLDIEKVGDGGVLINDNGKRYELLAERQSKPDVVKSYSGKLEKTDPIILLDKSQTQDQPQSAEAVLTEPEAAQQPQEPVVPELTPEEQLKQTQANIEWLKQMQSDPNSAGMSAIEANDMAAYGEMLKALEEESKRLLTETASDKNKPDTNSPQPNTNNMNNSQPNPVSPPAVVENKNPAVVPAPNEPSEQTARSRRIRNRR
ncbi:MAG: hypothetical protein ABFD79_00790 [Phycisphaerales bacterium]